MTSHIPLRDVADAITIDGVVEAVRIVDGNLRAAGNAAPRIAVAGLNPHAGDGGSLGREEIDVIAPAVARAQAEGIDARGPLPSDTIFVAARRGDFDAVVSMYHDQGQIAMKLMGFDSGVTLHGGLPVPVATCASGTAFDIVGAQRRQRRRFAAGLPAGGPHREPAGCGASGAVRRLIALPRLFRIPPTAACIRAGRLPAIPTGAARLRCDGAYRATVSFSPQPAGEARQYRHDRLVRRPASR